MIYSNKTKELVSYDGELEDNMMFEFPNGGEPVLFGDVHFAFKHRGYMYDTQICRVAFNISFLTKDNSILFTKYNVSPDAVSKDSRIDDSFFIKLLFEDYCS